MKRYWLIAYPFIIIYGIILLSSCITTQDPDHINTDICILGGSEAGFTAAIQAARMDKKVVLIEPTGHPGGMLVEGIAKDIRFGSSVVIGGIAREIYTAIERYYGREPKFDVPGWHSRYEPHVAEKIVEEFLGREKNIMIIRKTRIRETGGVHKENGKISSVVLENGVRVSAKLYIDASIEGHLLHFSGVSTETIREGNRRYGETKNGTRKKNTYRQFQVKVDPYIEPGRPESGLIRTIQEGEVGEQGAPSKYIQGYCFRLVLTRDRENRIPLSKPNGYDPQNYEIYLRYLEAGGQLFYPQANRPNGKTDLGSWHDLSANLYGENWKYPNGDYAIQKKIVMYHQNFTQGLIWFLQNDPDVSRKTRKNWEGWGLCKDEFTDNGGWPRRLYIRSARRMVSDYVMTEHLTRRENTEMVDDPVAIAWWPPDMHHARRIVKDGHAYNEGFVFGGDNWRPFGISWRALIPVYEECTNIISPTCPSSSYVAYGAVRILPTFMALGQSAGCAASLAIDSNIAVQDIEYGVLRKKLLDHKQILDLPENWISIITSTN